MYTIYIVYMWRRKSVIWMLPGNRGLGAGNLSKPSTRSTVLNNRIPQPWLVIPTVNINST